jgi:hypothetical protein
MKAATSETSAAPNGRKSSTATLLDNKRGWSCLDDRGRRAASSHVLLNLLSSTEIGGLELEDVFSGQSRQKLGSPIVDSICLGRLLRQRVVASRLLNLTLSVHCNEHGNSQQREENLGHFDERKWLLLGLWLVVLRLEINE